jgi:hypothetical protein
LPAACVLVLAATAALAQVGVRVDVKDKEQGAKKTRKASELIGSTVRLRGKKDLGKVSDLVIDDDGRVAYLLVRQGDEVVPVPWSAAKWDAGSKGVNVEVDVSPDKLKGVTFRLGSLPDFSSADWLRLATKVWGAREKLKERREERREKRQERREKRKDG